MQTVLLADLPKGDFFTVTTADSPQLPTPPPWVYIHRGWIACARDMYDSVIYAEPGCPLFANSASALTKKLIGRGLVLHFDDE